MPDTYSTISQLPDLGSVEATDRLVLDRLGAAVAAGSFVVGQAYQIVTVGTTSFITIGAASNTVGAYFVASGAGSGTGTAAPINTGDAAASAMPVSTATQTALDLKANSSGTLAQFAATTSAQLLGVISDETGTGSLVFATSPTLVTPALGTPASGTLTNCTGLPFAAGVSNKPTTLAGYGITDGFTQANVRATPITGFTSGAGTVAATDTLLEAIQKLDGNDAAKLPITFTAGTITYGATVDLDLAALAGGYRTISLTGALTFTTSNRASGRQVTLRLLCDATARALTFPAGWVFLGTKPSTLAASKTAVLSLTFFGTADADCVAAYGVQS